MSYVEMVSLKDAHMKKRQMEVFLPTKRKPRERSVWQVPPMERTLRSIARTLDELFTRQTDLRRELLRSEAHSNHLLRDLRSRHDALPLITSLHDVSVWLPRT